AAAVAQLIGGICSVLFVILFARRTFPSFLLFRPTFAALIGAALGCAIPMLLTIRSPALALGANVGLFVLGTALVLAIAGTARHILRDAVSALRGRGAA